MDLGTAFAFACARRPDAEAFVEGGRRCTYGAWLSEIRAVAGGLRQLGLIAGNHLVVVMRNHYEMATLYWACHLLGVIFTPVNFRASSAEIAYCLEDAEASAVAYDGAAREAAPAAAARLGIDPRRLIVAADGVGEGSSFEQLLAARPVDGPATVDEHKICLMLYTSGTTGRPKGVPRSHRAELMAAVSQIAHHHYRAGESALGVMPMFHTMGVRTLLSSALVNGKLVCMPDYAPEAVLRLTAEERISALFLVPTMFHDILREPGIESFDLSRVSRVSYAGMAMTPALVEKCLAMLRPDVFVNHYGSSEIYTFTICDHRRKPGCAGRAGLNQRIRVVSADPDRRDDIETDLPPGEPGEIIASLRSPEAFSGYWKRPDADARSIQGSWYRTGDLGRFDQDGELYVLGRVDDMIISGGENIYPEEVEDALARSRLVAGVAVVGLPDERLGTRVVAFVEPADVLPSPQALDDACLSGGLARYKRPRDYVFVKSIPRSASGKILRRRLRVGDYEKL
ncbi:MAG TPA: class I adenylate-forming enzyme family protein [Xanthobacteraceae bacterium]|nr:class I adenylate-forming enzyme family protein [Xanthobacteraceae bacterium]